ncbi:mCG1044319 [Mus musculus]|nr:mCG1044319 [Mus musculus]
MIGTKVNHMCMCSEVRRNKYLFNKRPHESGILALCSFSCSLTISDTSGCKKL